MTTDQTAASEAPRVLLLHASFKASPEIQETDTPWWWECDGCSTKVAEGGTGRSDVFAGLAAHQADALAEAGLLREEVTGQSSDGYHTFDELYEYRMLYNAHAAEGWAQQGKAVKSWRHSDGEECFGGGWFVVVVDLYPHGQVSNHYPAADWDLFHVPEVDCAPEWDGHTPQEAAQRLRASLSAPAADDCGSCAACDPGLMLDGQPTGFPSRMSVCPDCGNKRCPKAANHRLWQCSGSNAVGQVGVRVQDAQNPAESGLGSGSEGDGA